MRVMAALFASAMLIAALPATAQPTLSVASFETPPDTVLPGTIVSATVNTAQANCFIAPAIGYFQRSGSGPALIAADISILSNNGASNQTATVGAMTLNFTKKTAGTIALDSVTREIGSQNLFGSRVKFADYAQSYDLTTGILNVSFTIKTKSCDVPFTGIYHSHP